MVAYYPTGVPLFTSPDWRELDSGGGEYRFGSHAPRVHMGGTKWPVVVDHYPPLLAHRSGTGDRQEGRPGGVEAHGEKGVVGALPVLHGDQARDLHLLCTLQPCFVC